MDRKEHDINIVGLTLFQIIFAANLEKLNISKSFLPPEVLLTYTLPSQCYPIEIILQDWYQQGSEVPFFLFLSFLGLCYGLDVACAPIIYSFQQS